jgi:hypothetical protein
MPQSFTQAIWLRDPLDRGVRRHGARCCPQGRVMGFTSGNRDRDNAIRERMRAGERAAAIGADLGLSASGVYAVNKREKAKRRLHAAQAMVPPGGPAKAEGGDRLSAMLRTEIAAARAEMASAPVYRGGWR